jgi:hypothetical protein
MDKNDRIFYMTFAVDAAALVMSAITLNPYLILLVGILTVVSVMVSKLWYILEAVLFKHTNLIAVVNGYELSGTLSAAVRVTDNGYAATTAAVITAPRSDTVEKMKIENVVAHVGYPFRFVMQIEKISTKKITEKLRTRLGMKEIELSRIADPSKGKGLFRANQLRRDIERISQDITSISSGEEPLRVVYYLLTTAFSNTVSGAEERAKSQMRELCSEFDAVLNSTSEQIVGPALLQLLKLDSMLGE